MALIRKGNDKGFLAARFYKAERHTALQIAAPNPSQLE